MKQFKDDINKVLKNCDTERTLLLRFFDAFLNRKKDKQRFSFKDFGIGVITGMAIFYFIGDLI
jgi:hypothetical protein